MKFVATAVDGVWLIGAEPVADERGSFARTFDAQAFAAQGLSPLLSQSSLSFNTRAGTLRGLHYQVQPHAEAKLVRCTRGAIYDVAVDLRHGSPSYRRWFAAELSADNRQALYIPEGCAHGFLTLCDGAEVSYHIAAPYVPESGRGVRWDDPAFGIAWPHVVCCISERDRNYPDFND